MINRFPVHVISHVHSRASSGPASDLNAKISEVVHDIVGRDEAPEVCFYECFTAVEHLQQQLTQADSPKHPQAGILTVTDHMNALSHRLPDDLLRAVAAEPRMAACSEIYCVEQDIDGEYRRAPEVLVYGGIEPVDGPYGRYYGVSQADLDDIYVHCVPDGQQDAQTTRLLEFCAERGIACALPHPFDGHWLSLEATVDVISRGRFIETVNGGFPARSSRVLERLITFQNRIVNGWQLEAHAAQRFPLAAQLAERIVAENRSLLHAIGGSDSHTNNFARVTTRFLADQPRPVAGDFFASMLSDAQTFDPRTLSITGDAGTAASVLRDVLRILLQNFWFFRREYFGRPVHAARFLANGARVVYEELAGRARHQRGLLDDVERSLPAGELLAAMTPPLSASEQRPAWDYAPDHAALGIAAPQPPAPPPELGVAPPSSPPSEAPASLAGSRLSHAF